MIPSDDGFVRVVEPYVHSYTSHVKARWIGKSVLDVYCNEFGGYSRQYYESAIQSGMILLSNQRVSPFHVLENGQHVLSHTMHLHEPPVKMDHADIIIIAETDELIVVDKPSTMVVHPTGSSRFNALLTILEQRYQHKLYTIHRLDRVTSGICLFAKDSKAAQKFSAHLLNNDNHKNMQKYYLARVKGKFPLNINASSTTNIPRLQTFHDEVVSGLYTNKGILGPREQNAFGYWTTHLSISSIHDSRNPLDWWLNHHSDEDWLHLACPTRVLQYKDYLCAAGSFCEVSDEVYNSSVKASQTSFGVVSYCTKTDSTPVVCKPSTGRSHQIRVHLQFLGHPIATDATYGGGSGAGAGVGDECVVNPTHSLVNHGPSSAASRDIMDMGTTREKSQKRLKGETLGEFVSRLCPTCRQEKEDASTLQNLHAGIWLRAIKYQYQTESFSSATKEIYSFQAKPPSWVEM